MGKTIPNNYNDQYEVYLNNETWTLAEGSSINNPDGHGIHEGGSYHDNLVEVNGSITAISYGSAGVAIQGTGSEVTVGGNASINGWYGVELFGDDQSVSNAGIMNVYGTGIYSDGDNNAILNDGMIKAHPSAQSDVDGIVAIGETTIINNGSGSITVTGNGITVKSYTDEVTEVTNFGSITADNLVFYGWSGNETFKNRGLAFGDVSMGAGKDTFDGENGSITGSVMGGNGDDTYIISSADVVLFEKAGEGIDEVKSSVNYTLKTDFENLTLIGSSGLTGKGTVKDNVITGNSGANRLFGNGGADTLEGGTGNDRLTGGYGADKFVFASGDGQDRILDFTAGIDHIDIADVSGINSFTDLKRNHMTVSGDDLVITSGAFKLILEDTDKTELSFFDFSF
ncbi:calcium-binding protein [Rhizobium alvei]|uniref:Calcium-binding protein n=1 Tax=Rhizobium alvei TaxID=1132659 RepID=A0ABT8YGD5_9HYPH|nr:calcium-binding protein [Rhizobium alvei]MDO6962731.1 calcium-binding protein [Rhizobium alvei]